MLVTRPDPEGSTLCRLIAKAGGRAIHFPTLEFKPVEHVRIPDQDWIIFVSPRAVYYSLPALSKTAKFAAIGEATALVLRQAGYEVEAIPTVWDSEGLLNLPAFHAVSGKKIAIICGLGGRELLAETLKARGATVTKVAVYERSLPEIAVTETQDLIKQGKIDVIIGTSFTGILNLKTLIGEDIWQNLQQIPLIAVGERIKLLAQDLGFQTIWVAQNASHRAILATLASIV